MMDKFMVFDSTSETLGLNMIGLIHAANREIVTPLLEKHQLTEIKPDVWYPLQPWLDIFTEIVHLPGGWSMLVDIGMRVGENIPLPPEIQTIEQLILGYPEPYRQMHRGDVGELHAELNGERRARITQLTPYPEDSGYGVLYGMTRKFLTEKGISHSLTVFSNHAGQLNFPRRDSEPLILDIQW